MVIFLYSGIAVVQIVANILMNYKKWLVKVSLLLIAVPAMMAAVLAVGSFIFHLPIASVWEGSWQILTGMAGFVFLLYSVIFFFAEKEKAAERAAKERN